MIRMLNVNTVFKEGDIGLMIAITLNIRFRTSSTTINIESYGQLTLSPIASNIHKIVGW